MTSASPHSRPAPPAATDDDNALARSLHRHRERLLDATRRNALINYPLAQHRRSKRFIRVVDELPDFLFERLLDANGRPLGFRGLERDDPDTPVEEKTPAFRNALAEARRTDPEYLDALRMPASMDGADETLARIERDLRNRVRAGLGMGPADLERKLTPESAAIAMGIQPGFELPRPDAETAKSAHADNDIQTLLFEDELESKLGSLHTEVKRLYEEQGVDSLYASFGCLEWYEDADCSGKPLLSPLLLLPVAIKRELRQGKYVFLLNGSERDGVSLNRCLAQRLARDFGLELPELPDGDDAAITPEAYFETVERWLERHRPRWALRRYVQIGILHFARLVMYEDLAPARWSSDLAAHPVFAPLIHGADEDGAEVVARPDSPGDDTVLPTPKLIADADASQHRVVAEALTGRNLAVEGPPGTGKSQTITNLIAAALAEGRTVLFLAEKMAALDVVFTRLKEAELGPYCLQLHAPGAQKTAVLTGLKERIETTAPPSDSTATAALHELEERRALLNTYAATIGSRFGPDDETVHAILMRARRAIDRLEAAGERASDFEIADAVDIPAGEREHRTQAVHQLAEARRRALQVADTQGRHPFEGVECDARDPFVQDDVLALFEDATAALSALAHEAAGLFERPTVELAEAAVDAAATLPTRLDDIDREILTGLADETAHAQAETFLADLARLTTVGGEQPLCLEDEAGLLADEDFLREVALTARRIGDPELTLDGLDAHLTTLAAGCAELERFAEELEHARAALAAAQPPRSVGQARQLIESLERIRQLPKAALVLLDGGRAAAPEAVAAAEDLAVKAKALCDEKDELADWLDLDALPRERERLVTLARRARNAVPGAWILASIREDRAFLRRCSRRRLPPPGAALGALVERVIALRDSERAFDEEAGVSLAPAMGRHYKGIHSPFSAWSAAQRHIAAARALGIYRAPALAVDEATQAAVERELTPERLQDMRAAIAKESDEIALAELERRRAHDAQALTERRAVAERLHRIGFDPTCTLGGLADAAALRRERLALVDHLERHPAAATLGPLFAGTSSEPARIRAALELRACLRAVPVRPASAQPGDGDHAGASPWYLSGRYAELRAQVLALRPALDHARERWQRLVETAKIDESRFLEGTVATTSLDDLGARLERCLAHRGELAEWSAYRKALDDIPATVRGIAERVAAGTMSADVAHAALEAGHYRRLARGVYEGHRDVLSRSGAPTLEPTRRRFAELDRASLDFARTDVRRALHERAIPRGIASSTARERTDLALVRHELTKKKRHLPIRRLFQRAGAAITALQPCLLMSPMSVAQYLPKQAGMIDLLVIDEASQMRPEDAFGAILRSRQVVVVGDPKQLPPTNFFRADGDAGGEDEEDDPGDVESILDKALGAFRPERRLLWHYRSRHPMLAAFSNRVFYGGELTLFPSPVDHQDGGGVHHTYVANARYKRSRNPPEAEQVIAVFREQIRRYPDESVGIVALNQPQADLIGDELDRLRAQDEEIRTFLERYDDGLSPVFVKNLENVQGDERDTIIISTVYGPDADSGRVRQGFGPINRATGWRRLNVLITRARVRIHLVTSLRSTDILVSEHSSRGVPALRDYLHFAETGSLPPAEGKTEPTREPESPFELEVGEAVARMGYEVRPQVGVEGFFIDLAVVDPRRNGRFLLGIECDGATYHSTRSARERDRLRQSILEQLGWSLHRIWSTDWFTNADRERHRLEEAIRARLAATAPDAETTGSAPVVAVDASDPASSTSPTALERASGAPPPPAPAPPSSDGRRFVEVGDEVTVEKLYDDGERMRFVLVDGRSDTEHGRVSINSPLGECLLGLEEGDHAEYEAGVYLRRVRVLAVRRATAEAT